MTGPKVDLDVEYVLDDGVLTVDIRLGNTTIIIEDKVDESSALPTLIGSLPAVLDRVWDSIEGETSSTTPEAT